MKFHFLQHGRLGSRCVRCCLSGSLMSFICWKSFAELVRCQVFKQLYCHCVNINTLYLIKEWTEKKKTRQVTKQCDLLRTWSIRVCHCLQFDHNHLILMFWFVFMYSLHSVPFPLQVTSALGLFCFQHVTA